MSNEQQHDRDSTEEISRHVEESSERHDDEQANDQASNQQASERASNQQADDQASNQQANDQASNQQANDRASNQQTSERASNQQTSERASNQDGAKALSQLESQVEEYRGNESENYSNAWTFFRKYEWSNGLRMMKKFPIKEGRIPPAKLKDFMFLDELGKGGFGKVYFGYETSRRKYRAIKVIKKSTLIDVIHLENAISERWIMADITHPFITSLVHSFHTTSHFIYVFPYHAGRDLGLILYILKEMSEREAVFYLAEVGNALNFLHSKGIIYRDLKPENVALEADGHVKLIDFGLSYYKQSNKYIRCGSKGYMAPEVVYCDKKPYDHMVDWFSYGAFAYDLVEASPPFLGNDFTRMLPLQETKYTKDFVDLMTGTMSFETESRYDYEDLCHHPIWRRYGIDLRFCDIERLKPPHQFCEDKQIDDHLFRYVNNSNKDDLIPVDDPDFEPNDFNHPEIFRYFNYTNQYYY